MVAGNQPAGGIRKKTAADAAKLIFQVIGDDRNHSLLDPRDHSGQLGPGGIGTDLLGGTSTEQHRQDNNDADDGFHWQSFMRGRAVTVKRRPMGAKPASARHAVSPWHRLTQSVHLYYG
jgi:hypothetical protein